MIQTTHPEFCSTDIPPGCLTFGIFLCQHSIWIFHIRPLTPDGRGWHFNFSGQTYPDPLIAYPESFAAILHSVAVFSWSFQIFATDILRYFASGSWKWEAFQLPRLDISGSSDNVAGEFRSHFAQCRGVLLKLPDMCDRQLGYFEIFCFRYLLSKSPNSPCNPPIIGFLSY